MRIVRRRSSRSSRRRSPTAPPPFHPLLLLLLLHPPLRTASCASAARAGWRLVVLTAPVRAPAAPARRHRAWHDDGKAGVAPLCHGAVARESAAGTRARRVSARDTHLPRTGFGARCVPVEIVAAEVNPVYSRPKMRVAQRKCQVAALLGKSSCCAAAPYAERARTRCRSPRTPPHHQHTQPPHTRRSPPRAAHGRPSRVITRVVTTCTCGAGPLTGCRAPLASSRRAAPLCRQRPWAGARSAPPSRG